LYEHLESSLLLLSIDTLCDSLEFTYVLTNIICTVVFEYIICTVQILSSDTLSKRYRGRRLVDKKGKQDCLALGHAAGPIFGPHGGLESFKRPFISQVLHAVWCLVVPWGTVGSLCEMYGAKTDQRLFLGGGT